jgi:adenylate cyclase
MTKPRRPRAVIVTTTSTQSPFNDVAEGRYFTKAVAWAYENGITTGKSPTVFVPGDAVTRVEFAAFLSRYDNLP